MNKLYKFCAFITIGILLLTTQNFSQMSEKKNDSAVGYNCKAVQNFFLDALVSSNKPGGLIITRSSCSENVVFPEYKPEELSLNGRLNLITQMNPNYNWKDEQGVINLFPTKSIPELLSVKISNLDVTFDNNLNLVIDKILQLPEVTEKLKKLNLNEGIHFGGLQSPPNKRPPTEMVFKDKTLQQVLNEIVKKRGRGVWVYSESNYNDKDIFMLDFLVR